MKNIIMRMMNRILPSCKEVSHLTSQAMDESLSLKKRIELRIHLSVCIWCRRNAEQLLTIRKFARTQAAADNEQAKLSTDAQDRITKLLKQQKDQS